MTAATILQKVKVHMKDFETCKARYAEIPMNLTDTTLCASADGKDACQVRAVGLCTYEGNETQAFTFFSMIPTKPRNHDAFLHLITSFCRNPTD